MRKWTSDGLRYPTGSTTRRAIAKDERKTKMTTNRARMNPILFVLAMKSYYTTFSVKLLLNCTLCNDYDNDAKH